MARREIRYVSLRTVAECYDVEIAWVEEVYEFGLLGEGQTIEGEAAITDDMLERVAEIRRLQIQHGVNLPGIAIILDLLRR